MSLPSDPIRPTPSSSLLYNQRRQLRGLPPLALNLEATRSLPANTSGPEQGRDARLRAFLEQLAQNIVWEARNSVVQGLLTELSASDVNGKAKTDCLRNLQSCIAEKNENGFRDSLRRLKRKCGEAYQKQVREYIQQEVNNGATREEQRLSKHEWVVI
jgi:hypothetical protein